MQNTGEWATMLNKFKKAEELKSKEELLKVKHEATVKKLSFRQAEGIIARCDRAISELENPTKSYTPNAYNNKRMQLKG